MPFCIRVCLAIDLILMGSNCVGCNYHNWLPLGGSSLTQFAILMCFGVAVLEIFGHKNQTPFRDQKVDESNEDQKV